jgi:hypothetical protein
MKGGLDGTDHLCSSMKEHQVPPGFDRWVWGPFDTPSTFGQNVTTFNPFY